MQKRLCLTTTQYNYLLGDVMNWSVSAINCVLFWRRPQRNHGSILSLQREEQKRKRVEGVPDLASGNCRVLVPSEAWRSWNCSWGSRSGLETEPGSVRPLSWCLPTMDLNQLVTPEQHDAQSSVLLLPRQSRIKDSGGLFRTGPWFKQPLHWSVYVKLSMDFQEFAGWS